jgi:hypothetical protein
MPLTGSAKAVALDAAIRGITPTISAAYVGLLRWSEAGKALTTPFADASTDTFTSTAHGYANGDLVVFTALSGGLGVVLGDPYFVVNVATNTFQASRVPGGTALDFTSNATAGTVRRLVELTGGSPAYARLAITWGAASGTTELIDDTTNGLSFNVPAGATVDYIAGYSAVTTGTLMWIDDPPAPDSFTSQGLYLVTDVKIGLPT